MPKSLLLAVLALLSGFAGQATALDIGDQAPTFEKIEWITTPPPATSKWTVVEFWATWAPGCSESMQVLETLQHEHSNLTIIGLSEETPENIRSFLDNLTHRVTYSVGSAGVEVLPKWTAQLTSAPLPIVFLINPDGHIAWYGNTFNLKSILSRVMTGNLDLATLALIAPLENNLTAAIAQRHLNAIDRETRAILAIDRLHLQALIYASMVARQQTNHERFRSLFATIDPLVLDAASAHALAQWLLEQEQFVYRHLDLALPLAKHALDTDQDNPAVHATWAHAQALIGDLNSAINHLEHAIELSTPDNAQAHHASLAYYQHAAALKANQKSP